MKIIWTVFISSGYPSKCWANLPPCFLSDIEKLELFSGVKDLQSIYIPFSGKYTSIIDTAATVKCNCGTVGMYKSQLAQGKPAALNARAKPAGAGANFPPDRQTDPRARLLSTKVDGQMVNYCFLLAF